MTAYRKNHSCETTLLKLVEAWKREIDRKNIVGVLSTDMSKAFDSLHPPLLINKLKAYGFSDCATDLLRSYFSERKSRVRLGTEITSEWKKTTTRGCPQGSALGPLLWNIFQNDLPYNVSKCNLTMYADDHQLYFAGKSIEEVENTINEEGKIVSKWYENNLLQGNVSMYQVISFGPKDKPKELNIVIVDSTIEHQSEIKILGLTIDDKLNFASQVSNVCKKASRQVGVISRLCNIIPTKATLQIFKSAILPHLTYCQTAFLSLIGLEETRTCTGKRTTRSLM